MSYVQVRGLGLLAGYRHLYNFRSPRIPKKPSKLVPARSPTRAKPETVVLIDKASLRTRLRFPKRTPNGVFAEKHTEVRTWSLSKLLLRTSYEVLLSPLLFLRILLSPTTWRLRRVLRQPFAGSIELEPRAAALLSAREAHDSQEDPDKLNLWTDAGIYHDLYNQQNSFATMAVVWKHPQARPDWQCQQWKNREVDSRFAEFYTVVKAVELALKLCTTGAKVSEVHIYTDLSSILLDVRDHHALGFTRIYRTTFRYRYIIELARLKANVQTLLKMGVPLTLHWVPAHSGIVGNAMAHSMAGDLKKKIKSGATVPEPRTFAPVRNFFLECMLM